MVYKRSHLRDHSKHGQPLQGDEIYPSLRRWKALCKTNRWKLRAPPPGAAEKKRWKTQTSTIRILSTEGSCGDGSSYLWNCHISWNNAPSASYDKRVPGPFETTQDGMLAFWLSLDDCLRDYNEKARVVPGMCWAWSNSNKTWVSQENHIEIHFSVLLWTKIYIHGPRVLHI